MPVIEGSKISPVASNILTVTPSIKVPSIFETLPVIDDEASTVIFTVATLESNSPSLALKVKLSEPEKLAVGV